ncbi:uncharacterized protein LOC103008269 isoform X12 [Balaenoptera acutorostrata]|uniref:Uncharacterized protein LOC103008269 isoform X12 n=1 Tax=Balaenoptera acutorostrata TaxID=9767 RepID=A0ABM3TJK4_BALAC|nr:uncharacterized protein LOC103008269 isoform X12 [Balaenoptera acutorostrata]
MVMSQVSDIFRSTLLDRQIHETWRAEKFVLSHLCPGQNVPGQLHFTEGAFTNGAEDLEVINMSLLASRFGCEALHPGDLLTTLTDSTT